MKTYTALSAFIFFLSTPMSSVNAALPDPTRPADYSTAQVVRLDTPRQKVEFSLNAIRISASDRSAIINGKVVRVGDAVNNAIVKEINAIEVVLDHERTLLTLPLFAREYSKQYKKPAGDE